MPPILIIHGTCSQPAHFNAWAAYFRAAGYDCRVPPLPGRMPVDEAVLAGATFDDFVAAMRKALAGFAEPPVVIGYSMGALIAQRLAGEAPVAALVLLAPATPFLLPPRLRLIPSVFRHLRPVLTGRPFRITDDEARQLVLHHLAVAEQEELIRDIVPESGKAFRRTALALVRIPPQSITCPVLCVAGSEDRVVSESAVRRLARRYGAEFLRVPGCGHFLSAGSLLEEVAAPVRAWIDALSAAPR
ncbi:MAG TPA: alpha/beta hydrolase [Bauldia sp.]|nr:alpha/beta hydrolase [Bauldia sp.]